MLAVGGTRVIFTPARYRGVDHREIVDAVRAEVASVEHHVVIPDPDDDDDSFWARVRNFPDDAPAGDVDAAAVGLLCFTSGTEAQPKAIMQTEQTMNVEMRALYEEWGMTAADVVWVPSPIGHATGLKDGMRVALYNGLTMVLQDRWDPDAAAALIERHGCSMTVAATTFLQDLIAAGQSGSHDLSSLRLFGSGGAPVPSQVVESAADLGINVLRLYGSTEMAMVTTTHPDTPLQKRVETDGRPLRHVEVQVRDADGNPLIGVPGEIYARGPSASVGFFADPERTASTYLDDGWIRSGDLGLLDDDGYLTIVGRIKEIIIRGGMNVAPREIEDIIGTHPDVADVAVIGIPDERLGEIVCACVVAKAGVTLDLDGIVSHLQAAGLATYKLPQRLELVEVLPKTASGKIRKVELVEALAGAH
jgi:acyl-coenzyme A synthetase/AMP-(fatty) acid ligase